MHALSKLVFSGKQREDVGRTVPKQDFFRCDQWGMQGGEGIIAVKVREDCSEMTLGKEEELVRCEDWGGSRSAGVGATGDRLGKE